MLPRLKSSDRARRRTLSARLACSLLCATAACRSDSSAASDAAWSSAKSDAAWRVPLASAPTNDARPPQGVEGARLLDDTAALVRWLVDHNAEVAAQNARVAQAAAAADQSKLYQDPSADFTWGGINVGEKNPSDLAWSDSQNYEFGLHETFEIGKRGPRIEGALLRLDSERVRYVHVLGEKVHDARAALAREVYLHARIAELEENLKAAQEMLKLESTRLAHGDISGNDYDRLVLDTTLLELEMPRTKAELEAASADVRAILGAPYVPGSAEMSALVGGASLPPGQLDVESALENRADHRAIALEVQATEKDVKLAEARRIPDPTVGIAYTHDNLTAAGNQPDTMQLSVGINLPIFDRGQHESRRAAEHARELQSARLQSMRDAESDATSLLSRKAALEGVLKRIEEEAIPKSKQVLDVTSAAFDRGELKLTDVLLARRTHIDLALKHMDLQFESFSIRNDLRRVLGLDAELARAVAGEPQS
jgi:cobalt-zinc-cadmium efflux system outer membrane protein